LKKFAKSNKGCIFTPDLKTNKMTLTEKINSNPYLKVSNCTDIADIESAMDDLRKLDAEFGENNKTLLKLWAKFLDKKKKLEAKTSTSKLLFFSL
jgi:hypothetical protein